MSQKKDFAISVISHGGIGVTNEKGETVRNLTGSCHELAVQYHDSVLRILVDVGGYQGAGSLERDMKKIARGVSDIVLTHPHMDHIGDLPTLYHGEESEHYCGKIYATPGTRNATYHALTDAAKILQQRYESAKLGSAGALIKKIESALQIVKNYEKRNSGTSPIARGRGGRKEKSGEKSVNIRYEEALKFLEPYKTLLEYSEWKKILLPEPPFIQEDVERACDQIKELSISQREKEILKGKVFVSFYNAGHIIGSACALFKILDEQRKPHYVLFTGDIGSYKWDLHINGLPEPPNNLFLDAVVIESTYGGKVREPFEKGRKEFEDSLINAFKDVPDTAEKKGRKAYKQVVHACFSLDRLQNILFRVISLQKEKKLPPIPIFVDSPLGINYIRAYIEEARHTLKNLKKPKQANILSAVGKDFIERERKLLEDFIEYLEAGNCNYIPVTDATTREDLLGTPEEQRIIITASGMANGGPVMAYLEAFAEDPTSAFYFPGYLAEGTLGQQLAGVVQTKSVEINGIKNEVRARMKNFTFLSGHGDEEDIIRFLESLKFRENTQIIVVHGDKDSSSTALAHTINRQLGISAEQIRVPDIGEEIYVWGDGIKKDVPKVKSTTQIETLIQELKDALQTQDALLSEKMREANELRSIASRNESKGSWVIENENSANLAGEIMILLGDIAKIPEIIEKLRGLKSDEEISKDLTEEIKKYRHNIVVPLPSESEPTVTSTPKIQIKRTATADKTTAILSELPKEEPQESKYLPKLQEIIQGHNEANSRLIEEVRSTVSGPVLARFQTAMNLIKELRKLYDTIIADRETLASMRKAQERRSIDEIPASINGKEIDKRKIDRLSRLQKTQAPYENASSIAIETLEERIRENEEKAEEHRIFLREYIGAFSSSEQVSAFLATGRIPTKRIVRLNKAGIESQIQKQDMALNELRISISEVTETIEAKSQLLGELEKKKQDIEATLKHIPEYISSLLQSLKKRLFDIRKDLASVEEVNNELSRLEEEIFDVTTKLRDTKTLIAELEELGVAYIPRKRENTESTIAIYTEKKIELEKEVSKLRKSLQELQSKLRDKKTPAQEKNVRELQIDMTYEIAAIDEEVARIVAALTTTPKKTPEYNNLEKSRRDFVSKKGQLIKEWKEREQRTAWEKKIAEITIDMVALERELGKVNTILSVIPENLHARYNQLEKSRKEVVKKKEQLVKEGLNADALLGLAEEANQVESMIAVLSEKLKEPAKLFAFLEKSGIAYIPHESTKQKAPKKDTNKETESPKESTYTTYRNRLLTTDKQIYELRGELDKLKRDTEQMEVDILMIENSKKRLQSTLTGTEQEVVTKTDEYISFWLPDISPTEISQGIYLAISELLEKMPEYKKFKQNLSKIRGMDIADSTMTEKEFSEKVDEINQLAKENENLHPTIVEKLVNHFASKEK